MVTRAVYVLGGAGSGKSTFMAEFLELIDAYPLGPLEDLHTTRNARGNPVTLRGHRFAPDGLYLGCMREAFPGTDGLDRASSLPGAEWLRAGGLPSWIIAEGATLSTRPFFTALALATDLLVVHLHVDPMIADLRFLQRGSAQDPGWVQNTVTRARNLTEYMREIGTQTINIDTADPAEWNLALAASWAHLTKES